ncbi:DUF3581 family protein [Pseudoalteromonas sp. MMG005]|uniref:DUF3581 family protein n=1 Tax=Pseudoalteromonas sp. MMG005 TaxID=2822682 RepID=UPI001B3A15BA|nr:DUF3581 family protein [Pseudoalteromonas sp. MMG005]MBQ4847007.1 DUF3581 family protein [Pseudoalteromonas sp. MMG005]
MLSRFYQEQGEHVVITREQGSQFAKQIADDFNPLHDVDAKKFCVPGDLLFALVLQRYGISDNMHFSFLGMVDETSQLNFPQGNEEFDITSNDKVMMSVKRDGDANLCPSLIESLTKKYVEFSGTAFPHVIIPLMAQQNVMINPARPMVIYESMAIHLDDTNLEAIELESDTPEFSYEGKRGKIILRFKLLNDGKLVGRGEKHMLVSGIRAYCQETVDDLIAYYNNRKATL